MNSCSIRCPSKAIVLASKDILVTSHSARKIAISNAAEEDTPAPAGMSEWVRILMPLMFAPCPFISEIAPSTNLSQLSDATSDMVATWLPNSEENPFI